MRYINLQLTYPGTFFCGRFRWTKTDQSSGMVVMEVSQLTGYSAVDLDDVKQQVGTPLKRVENKDDKMVMYFDEVCTVFTPLTFVCVTCLCLHFVTPVL